MGGGSAVKITCPVTQREIMAKPAKDGGVKVPRGWKRHDGRIYSPEGWRSRYMLRSVTFPVASIEVEEGETKEAVWKAFRDACHEAWILTTQASNFLMTEFARQDPALAGWSEKMPKMAAPYLYPVVRERFPGLPSMSVVSLCQSVWGKYSSHRFAVSIGKESLPTHRYPTPIPMHNQAWKTVLVHGECPGVSLRLGDRRWTLRLRGGHGFHRQRRAWDQMHSGEAVRGELAIYQRNAGSTHRPGATGKKEVCVKLVAWLPKSEHGPRDAGTLFCRTDASALLVALNTKDHQLWTYHGDHIRRWQAEHRERLQRLADDSKLEDRRQGIPFADRRRAECARFNRRMKSAAQQLAAKAAGYARRRRFEAVKLTLGTDKPDFVWHQFVTCLEQKCDEFGLEFEQVEMRAE